MTVNVWLAPILRNGARVYRYGRQYVTQLYTDKSVWFHVCLLCTREDVPVCQHREDVLIVTKKSDPVTGPVIRCRAGHGHPPAIQYNWKFYPEQAEPETRKSGSSPADESNEMTMTYAGRSVRQLDSLLTETAVQGGGGDGGAVSYAFTTNTPVLKSYVSNVAAAASPSSSASGLPKFLHGRLECRAVNAMGTQTKPCVYRITGEIRRF